MPLGHFQDLRLHRAGIGIDIDHQAVSRRNGRMVS
jgi:hypothetical protein